MCEGNNYKMFPELAISWIAPVLVVEKNSETDFPDSYFDFMAQGNRWKSCSFILA